MKQWELDIIDAAAASIGMRAYTDNDGALVIRKDGYGAWYYQQDEHAQALEDIAAVAFLLHDEQEGKNDGK